MKNLPPTWLSDIKLVAWDLDGTLYPPSEQLSAYIYSQWLATGAEKLGLPEGKAAKELEKMYKKLASHTRVLDELGLDGQQFFIDIWKKIALQDFIVADPELPGLFAQLKALPTTQLAMLTNANTFESIEKKLLAIGLSSDIFELIIMPSKTGASKPQPQAFEPLWRETGIERSNIVYIGDKENTDMLPAKELGLRAIRVVWDRKLETVADATATSPAEVIRWFLGKA